jgi:hypothetical protein
MKARTPAQDEAAAADLLAWKNLGKARPDRENSNPVTECRWLKHGDSVPEGWIVSSKDPAVLRHHGQHCVLIERTVSA